MYQDDENIDCDYEDGSEEIQIEVNPADNFMYVYGKHKGYSTITHKLSNCFLLSAGAKEIYNIIKSHSYKGKPVVDISRDLMCDITGLEKNTVCKYLKELSLSGALILKRGQCNKVTYYLQEFHKIHILYQSEIIFMHVLPKLRGEPFRKKVTKYLQSDLFKSINSASDALAKEKQIVEWFLDLEVPVNTEPTTPVAQQTRPTPKISPSDVHKESGEGKPKPTNRIKAPNFNSKSIDEWNTQDFRDFYKQLYEDTLKLPLPPIGEKTVNALSTILRILKDNNLVKEYMEIFIDNRENFTNSSLSVFCWSSSQESIANYKATGKFKNINYDSSKKDKTEPEGNKDYKSFLDSLKSEEEYDDE
jgi:hypothetical protein